ncbi:MAG TPA: pectate lyase [Treponema sp.]|nr:pectate lyase [Treponema sp.]
MKIISSLLLGASLWMLSGCASSSSGVSVDAEAEKAFSERVEGHYTAISISDFSDGFNHARYKYPNSIPPWDLYDTDQILGFAENMIYLQNPDGGWAKNLDLQRKFTLGELITLQKQNKSIAPVTYQIKTDPNGSTIDNGNIFSQIKYLCQVYQQVPEERYLECAKRAVQWILNAQHPDSGGFTGADVYAITYNDDVMSDTLRLLRDISNGKDYLSVFDESTRARAGQAYNKGLQCILKTQITLTLSDNSKILTAWCQQHSHETLAPIWAREFEPPSVCTSESVKIVRLLMEIENPSEEIKNAITAACEWMDRDDVRIHGKRLKKQPLSPPQKLNGRYYDYEQRLIDDPSAPDIWARFYALDSSFDVVTGARKPIQGKYPAVNTPVWCDRLCIYVDDFNELSLERRNGYGYTRSDPRSLIEKDYPVWKARNGL